MFLPGSQTIAMPNHIMLFKVRTGQRVKNKEIISVKISINVPFTSVYSQCMAKYEMAHGYIDECLFYIKYLTLNEYLRW